jgi:hypothetical protein
LKDATAIFGARLEPEIETSAGRVVYRWQFKDVPQIIPEANMPPNVEVNPSILMSTFSSWEEVYQWWWALARDKIKADEAIYIPKTSEALSPILAVAGSAVI